MNPLLRQLPKVDDLLRHPCLGSWPRERVAEAVRDELAARRSALLAGAEDPALVSPDRVAEAAVDRVRKALSASLVPVINATGVVLHTNLGRAPLDPELLALACETAGGYSNLEFDLEARDRGSRYVHAARLLCELTGAEAALVLNNNAAAMVLLLSALARGREVIVSRGELIEIGGSFRLPEIFEAGGAQLREVGTTNRTRLSDYERALGPDTAMLLKVHRSNYAIVGFTEEVSATELASLGRARGVPVCEDLGSGCLVDLSAFGLSTPTARQQVEAGIDLVTFSGDKLLGGPQAGIVVGRADLVARLAKHPLTRAFRVDKLTLAVLERTLLAYRDGTAFERVPTLRLLALSLEALEARAAQLAAVLSERLGAQAQVTVVATDGMVGGGALPEARLASRGLRIVPRIGQRTAVAIDAALRAGTPPVLGRVADAALVLDLRTVLEAQDAVLVERIVSAVAG